MTIACRRLKVKVMVKVMGHANAVCLTSVEGNLFSSLSISKATSVSITSVHIQEFLVHGVCVCVKEYQS